MAPSPDPIPTAPAAGEPLAAPRHSHAGFSWAKFNQGVLPTLLAGVMAGMMLFTLNESSDRMTRIEDRIDRLEDRITRVEDRITRLEERITGLEERITRLEDRITRLEAEIDARFAKLEAEIDARFAKLEAEIDARFAKLEENQQEIAQTLTILVALFEAQYEAEPAP